MNMVTVKGSYKNGVIDLLQPIPGNIKEAELNIVVFPYDKTYLDTTSTLTAQSAYDNTLEEYKNGDYTDVENYLGKETYLNRV